MVNGKTAKKAANGRRYTNDQREKIVQFVLKVNGQRGRGGVAAAAKKYGVAASSIGKWLGEGTATCSAVGPASVENIRQNAKTTRVLAQLLDLRESIDALERELALKAARFDKLKRKV